MKKPYLLKMNFVVLLVIAFSLFAGAVYALEENAVVSVKQLNKMSVEIKIEFPGGIDGNFVAFVNQKQFACTVVSSTTLICTGPFRIGSSNATLTVYDKDSNQVFFQTTITSPKPPPNEGGQRPCDPTFNDVCGNPQ